MDLDRFINDYVIDDIGKLIDWFLSPVGIILLLLLAYGLLRRAIYGPRPERNRSERGWSWYGGPGGDGGGDGGGGCGGGD